MALFADALIGTHETSRRVRHRACERCHAVALNAATIVVILRYRVLLTKLRMAEEVLAGTEGCGTPSAMPQATI